MNAGSDRKPAVEPSDANLYINREFSLMEFNRRVLAMAADESVPLLERLRFLTISCSNMDEFFEIRVSGVKQQTAAGVSVTGPDEVRPQDMLARIHETSRGIVAEQYRVFNDVLLPKLAEGGIRILRRTEWNETQAAWAADYFRREVQPLLTPIGLDPAHPFPNVLNKILNFVVLMEGPDAFARSSGVSIVQAPRLLPRVIRMPREVSDGPFDFVLLSAVIHHNIGELFPRMDVKGAYQFRVTRNSDLFVDEEEVEDLAEALRFELPRRNFGAAVRLEVAENCPAEIATMLLDHFHLGPEDLYQVNGPVNLNRLMKLHDLVDRPDLKYPPFSAGVPKELAAGADLFDILRSRDMLLHHPYQSFGPVLDFIRKATSDPNVVAIMGTLYRTGAVSEVTEALIDAARAGKEVTACVELRARFDEAANIDLATRLQNAGAQVVYGVVGYKTHSKMMLLLRREEGRLRRYVHLGTGNYHTGTARAYTDLSLLTSNEEVCADVHKLFRELTSPGETPGMKQIYHSPFTLNSMIIERINEQAGLARQGKASLVRAKMNSLSDPGVIKALYLASIAGVPIDLIVRGVCCLRPGIPGVSETIRVRSIVGRFLEHSRVFSFGPNGEYTYASSADWMQRNLHRRVEVCFPITDPALKARVIEECLDIPLSDNVQAWLLQGDGTWVRRGPGDEGRRAAQEIPGIQARRHWRDCVRLAAIDIGSNSVHLIIADTFGPHSFQVIDRERERVKLGAGRSAQGRLLPGPSQAALSALKRCATLCRRHRVRHILAVATSAVREAENGVEFLQAVRRQTGIDARLIDGIEEARLIYRGVRHATDLDNRRALMLDLGGGSLEVMYGNARRLIVSESLPLGVQRLKDMFGNEDPLSRRSRTRLLKQIEQVAGPLLKSIRRKGIDLVVGTSGTHMTLGLACLRLRGRDPWGSLNGYEIHASELQDLAGELLNVNAAGRTRLPAIDERRGDVIHFGAAVLTTALRLVKTDTFQLCGSSLREGMLLQELERIHKYRGAPPNVRLASAHELIAHTGADRKRAEHLAGLALAIFDGTRRLHRLERRHRDLLETAALLDGIGRGMNYLDREHISYQLIRGGGLRGLTDREIEIIGLTARYSRRGSPKERHRHFSEMDTDGQHVVRVLAGILRIALGLDRGGRGVARSAHCRVHNGVLKIFAHVSNNGDLELAAARAATKLFSQAIDSDIQVCASRRD